MWLTWLPWRYLIRRVAQAHGFLDPIAIQSRLHRFAQPSEVAEPIELLRAGVLFHARGLINTRAIQHNLDWIWPYWVERQFDPKDDAFIPRAFSITHVNLTHRNWTAVGVPGETDLPIVDPRGLVTPFWDGWSLDGWIVTEDGRALYPSRLASVSQTLEIENGIAVVTEASEGRLFLLSRVEVILKGRRPLCRIKLKARADAPAWAVVAARPSNPEGVSFIHDAAITQDRKAMTINDEQRVEFQDPADRYRFSDYRAGDVAGSLPAPSDHPVVRCDVGLATAAALFELQPDRLREIVVDIPLRKEKSFRQEPGGVSAEQLWKEALSGRSVLQVPDERYRFLYDAALHAMVLHSPDDVYPGPYTYKRFWFRDASFILHAMICSGFADRAERVLDRFPVRQTRAGYFLSQEGEWDSNGEALWILHRFCRLTGRAPKREWVRAMIQGGRWIVRKRHADDLHAPHAGLMPSGFSAEHLGPNDFYYWDDFWSIAGLRSAAELLEREGEAHAARDFYQEAEALTRAVERSLAATAARRNRAGIPASPYRRMDAGAIGSLAAGYPLQLWPADERRLLDTANFLMENCFVNGGFFQDMIHSGINPYLTLHVAQVFLRAGDVRCFDLVDAVARLASPTGQWPEAIHPRTGGGCMGDGQHVWACAEWVLMMRNSFVREEGERLVLASGIPGRWLERGFPLSFGATPTPYGELSVRVEPERDHVIVAWEASWRDRTPVIEVRLPGFPSMICSAGERSVRLRRGHEA